MSLESASGAIAEEIRRQEFVEVFAHHDADGIAAGSILCHAMLRAGIRFRLRIRHEIGSADLAGDSAYLLCDMGAGMEDLRGDAMVVDHHLPLFGGEFHANPRLDGIDGERELSAAGTAYIVAQQIGDNRDLAGLVVCGIIGDGQEMAGKNLEIFNEAIANGVINPGRGVTLPGRDTTEAWLMATSPYLHGVSGQEQHIRELIAQAQDQKKGPDALRLDALLSGVVLDAAPATAAESLQRIYGDTFNLQREVIEDGHSLTAIIDACGKTGHGDIGATLCMRSSHYIGEAWEIARRHRSSVIAAAGTAKPAENATGVYEVTDVSVISDVADILSRDRDASSPVLVYARSGVGCRLSARAPGGRELGPLVRDLARSCGGTGGGHVRRAGATIPCDRIAMFAKGWQEALAS